MRPTQAPTILLSDYQEPAFWVETVDLHFALDPNATRVKSTIKFAPNKTRTDGPHDLRLDGRMLKLISAAVNGKTLQDDEILLDAEGLTIPADLILKTVSHGQQRWKSTPREIPHWKVCTCPMACIAPNARRRVFVKSLITLIAPM